MKDHDRVEELTRDTGPQKNEKNYWIKRLSGDLQKKSFPYDYQRPEPNLRNMEEMKFRIADNLLAQLMKISNDSDLRLHIILVTEVVLLLDKYLPGNDRVIILGAPIYKQEIEGDFINTLLILRHDLEEEMSFKELLLQASQTIADANEHVNYPLETLLFNLNLEYSRDDDLPLLDTAVLLENIHDPKDLRHVYLNVIFTFRRQGNSLEGKITYNACLYRLSTIKRIINHFNRLLSQSIFNVNREISDLEILTEEEKQEVLFTFNDTRSLYPSNQSIGQIFDNQVGKNPDRAALILEDQHLTYRQFNIKARQLSLTLISRGVKHEDIVGLKLDRSLEMMIGILGILKAGACYLPFDPAFPPERIDYMMKDSGANVLVTASTFSSLSPSSTPLTCSSIGNPSHLAYIIYTSGTTGKPKGTLISHANVLQLVINNEFITLNENDRILQLSNYAFDGSIFDIFGSILNGAVCVLLTKEALQEVNELPDLIQRESITVFFVTTALFNALVDEKIQCLRSVRKILFGGEHVSLKHTGKALDYLGKNRIIHVYGPTETTVYATYYPVNEIQDNHLTIPIGSPLSYTRAYLLDKDEKPLPVGVYGEIYIGGAGVSQGYLNNVELTHTCFHQDPYHPGSRWYKTGDVGRFLADGSIEFRGRVDNQVKIRGFRIEPGEIENCLLNHEKIKEAIVITREGERGEKYLCAYVVSYPQTDVTLPELREFLAQKLPDHMVPSSIVPMEKLPLTPNGKVHQKALPDPKQISVDTGASHVPPRNEKEKILAKIWEDVLGRKNIGIHDDFFILGGDSIVTIQVISRLAREGYKVEMRDIFSHSTLAELSPHLIPVKRIPPQETVSGFVPLTPVQHFFFEFCDIDTHYFNQAVMLYSGKGERFQVEALQEVILKLQEHHDALRMTFKRDKQQGWIQTNHGTDYPFELEIFDFRGQPGEKAPRAREDRIETIQASFHLDKGPLMKWTIFRHDQGDYLLITSHHLVIDTVSWRILFEDIETLYKQHQKGQPLQLPLKSDSYKTWSERLAEYAVSPALLREKDYWATLASTAPDDSPPFPRDFSDEGNHIKDAHTLSFCLNREHTELLLTRAHEAFGTEMNDLLLTALGLCVRQLWGNQKVAVTLEGHGREEIFADIDVNRTVGWFTSIYPVVLDMSYENHLPRQIKEIKECLRRVPHKGIGCGILRYLTPGEHTNHIDFKWRPQIGFNYLGRFDTNIREMSFQPVQETIKSTQSKEGRRLYELEIGGITVDKQLTMTITFSRKQYKLETMENFMSYYKRNLEQVIMVCVEHQKKELTPSDLTYKNLSIDQIDRISNLFQ